MTIKMPEVGQIYFGNFISYYAIKGVSKGSAITAMNIFN
jgi:hypothetical protein